MLRALVTTLQGLSPQVVYVSSKTWGGLAESSGMGRSSRTVHALAIILLYIRKKVEKHVLGRRQGSLASSFITFPAHAQGDALPLGVLQGLSTASALSHTAFPSLIWTVKFAQENSLSLTFGIRQQGGEMDLI